MSKIFPSVVLLTLLTLLACTDTAPPSTVSNTPTTLPEATAPATQISEPTRDPTATTAPEPTASPTIEPTIAPTPEPTLTPDRGTGIDVSSD